MQVRDPTKFVGEAEQDKDAKSLSDSLQFPRGAANASEIMFRCIEYFVSNVQGGAIINVMLSASWIGAAQRTVLDKVSPQAWQSKIVRHVFGTTTNAAKREAYDPSKHSVEGASQWNILVLPLNSVPAELTKGLNDFTRMSGTFSAVTAMRSNIGPGLGVPLQLFTRDLINGQNPNVPILDANAVPIYKMSPTNPNALVKVSAPSDAANGVTLNSAESSVWTFVVADVGGRKALVQEAEPGAVVNAGPKKALVGLGSEKETLAVHMMTLYGYIPVACQYKDASGATTTPGIAWVRPSSSWSFLAARRPLEVVSESLKASSVPSRGHERMLGSFGRDLSL